MLRIKRRLYQLILRLHPASFRDRFAREMSLDFEDALAAYGFPRLLADATSSLLRQWTAQLVSPDAAATLVPRPSLLAGDYLIIRDEPFKALELFRGFLASVALFALCCFAFNAAPDHTPQYRSVVFAASTSGARAPRANFAAQLASSAGAQPTFEVSTIRLRPPVAPPPEIVAPLKPVLAMMGTPDPHTGDRVHFMGSIRFFIASAYHIPIGSELRVVGGQAWLDSDTYDIQAKIEDSSFATMQSMSGGERQRQVERMEQALLADRFHLKAHTETRILPVYALQVANGNSRLVPAKTGEATLLPVVFNGHDTSIIATGVSMDQFVHSPLWRPVTDRLIVDQTGSSGRYDFNLKWTSHSPGPDTSDAPSSESSLFTALPEQLGLKLVPTKAPVEVLVIDHIEKPSEN